MTSLKNLRALGSPKAALAAAMIFAAASGLVAPNTADAGPVYTFQVSGTVLDSTIPSVAESSTWSFDFKFRFKENLPTAGPARSVMECLSCIIETGTEDLYASEFTVLVYDDPGSDAFQMNIVTADPSHSFASISLIGPNTLLNTDDWVTALSLPLASFDVDNSLFLTSTSGIAEGSITAMSFARAITAVPEPASLALMGLGLLGLAGAAGRRSRRRGGTSQQLPAGQPA